MCGRFTLTSSEEQIAAVLPGLVFDVPIAPRYNIAPTQTIAAVLNDDPQRVQGVRWGLIPAWAKDAAIGNRMINARGESLHEKPSFKRPLKKQRCLILADGFFEWQAVPGEKRKQPLYIRRRDAAPFAFAGLWDRWKSPEGERLTTATIITTAANRLVAPIHDRMPAILTPEHVPTWLAGGECDIEPLQACLAPYPAELLELYPVSTRVNTPKHDDAACVERADAG
jgi:putative SOS response-associated peptidase YedK